MLVVKEFHVVKKYNLVCMFRVKGGDKLGDSLRTEMRSIIKMKDYLTRNHRLIPDIRENDKTPSWDGEIIVYNSDSIAKKDIVGRVPVQVKGSIKKDLCKNTIKYTLECSDFRNYLSSNGVIIFVVYMKGYDECKIYYNALLSFDLTRLIENIGEQKTKTIDLQEFPKNDTTEIINIFLNFIKNQKLQGGTVDRRILSLEDVGKLRIELDGLHFGYTGVGLNNFINVVNYSLSHPTYIYAQPKGFNVKIPVDKINAEQVLSEIISPIIVDGTVFYDRYKIVYEIGKQCLHIGKSFIFHINTGEFDYKLLGKLSEKILDIKFLMALSSNQKIVITGIVLPPRLSDNSSEDIKKIEEYLYNLEEINLTFDLLGVEDDLEIDKLTNQEWKCLSLLVRSILYNESVPLSLNDRPGVGTLTLYNLNIMLACEKSDHGKYKILNFFGNYNLCCKFQNSGKDVIVSPYMKLKKDDFMKVSNLNYPRILESIINSPKSKYQNEFANLLVLEMLKAYDQQKYKNVKLLKSSKDIMQWLSSQETLDSEILTLNRLQIVKRMRKLTSKELREIYVIKHNTIDVAILVGTSILLESFIEAKLYYDRLSEENRNEFNAYPIANLLPKDFLSKE